MFHCIQESWRSIDVYWKWITYAKNINSLSSMSAILFLWTDAILKFQTMRYRLTVARPLLKTTSSTTHLSSNRRRNRPGWSLRNNWTCVLRIRSTGPYPWTPGKPSRSLRTWKAVSAASLTDLRRTLSN